MFLAPRSSLPPAPCSFGGLRGFYIPLLFHENRNLCPDAKVVPAGIAGQRIFLEVRKEKMSQFYSTSPGILPDAS